MIEIALERLRRFKTRSTSEKSVHGQSRLHIWTAELCDGLFQNRRLGRSITIPYPHRRDLVKPAFFRPTLKLSFSQSDTWNVVALFRKGFGPGQLVVPPKIRLRDSLKFRKSAFP